MLVKVSVENFKSFDSKEELSMISSSKIQGNRNHIIKINHIKLLKNAVVYGANASGKSNLVLVFSFIKEVLANGLPINSERYFCKNKENNRNRDSFFELQFTIGNKFYAYGFSANLCKRTITEEWLYELRNNENGKALFLRNESDSPELGPEVNVSPSEKNRYSVYADDFRGDKVHLFLAEINRGKKFAPNSKLVFFADVYSWLMNNMVILTPKMGISNNDTYSNQESLESISRLIKSFDTGVSEIKVKNISVEEFRKLVPPEMASGIIFSLQRQMQLNNLPIIQATWRLEDNYFNIKIIENKDPEIATLVLHHNHSFFDFDFAEESDGTKRLFDLVDLLITKRDNTLYVVDELERSLHPKLTEHFLKLFMEAHQGLRIQILFTTHEDTIMDQDLFRRDEIWFVERNNDNASIIYSLDRFKERYDKKISKAYLDGRYGAIPVFQYFSFKEDE